MNRDTYDWLCVPQQGIFNQFQIFKFKSLSHKKKFNLTIVNIFQLELLYITIISLLYLSCYYKIKAILKY